MHWTSLALPTLLLASPAICDRTQKPPGKDAILLSNVQTLTLRANRQTTSRRVSPVPQLNCVGPSKKICSLYQIETMRCTNDGYDYDAEDVQWTCTASLPSEFKLGATDVICEGYRSSEDKWVLKGSCGVEYRMLLTEQGERRFGKSTDYDWSSLFGKGKRTSGRGWMKLVESAGDILFFGFFAAVFLFILVRFLAECLTPRGNQRGRTNGRRWGWGGGGGGGGGGGPGDGYYPGPPPPYSSTCSDDSSSFRFGGRSATQGWRPGFWTGALGGAAAGYEMGRRAATANRTSSQQGGSFFGRQTNHDAGEGSSQTRSSPSFSATSTSTGFGSTRRR